jgi:two-component system chemotaxis sensor kinase CheA
MPTSISDALRVDRDVGHIELGIVDNRTLEIVNASRRFFAWINRSPAQRLSLCDLVPGLTAIAVHKALAENSGLCELESSFVDATRQLVALRIRLIQTGKSEISPLRLLAFDISEMRRKEDILRTVSGYLEAHKNIISESRKTLKALLDSLPLAVFMLDSTLKVTSESSKKTLELFGEDVCGQSFRQLTGLARSACEPLELALSGVPWDLMEEVLPKEFARGEAYFSLKFVPLFEKQMLVAVTVIVDDISEQRKLERSLKQTDADNKALVSILGAKNEFFDLVTLARRAANVTNCLSELRPLIHSLKGGFSFLECDTFAQKCHSIEDELSVGVYRPELGHKLTGELLREISDFMSRYGEILHIAGDQDGDWNRRSVQVDYQAIGNFFRQAKQKGAAPEMLQAIECLAEMPVSSVLSWLEKAWRKTLAREGKEGRPIKWLGPVRMAREPYRDLFQSFIHIIRNAVDHGIELPAERVWAGKNRAGSLTISTTYQEEIYRFEFEDDGAGIDPSEILESARRCGLEVSDNLSTHEIFMLLCEPEFTSKTEITELSGRGVGLDAVRRAARAYGGDVSIKSEKGKGTKISVWCKRQRYW